MNWVIDAIKRLSRHVFNYIMSYVMGMGIKCYINEDAISNPNYLIYPRFPYILWEGLYISSGLIFAIAYIFDINIGVSKINQFIVITIPPIILYISDTIFDMFTEKVKLTIYDYPNLHFWKRLMYFVYEDCEIESYDVISSYGYVYRENHIYVESITNIDIDCIDELNQNDCNSLYIIYNDINEYQYPSEVLNNRENVTNMLKNTVFKLTFDTFKYSFVISWGLSLIAFWGLTKKNYLYPSTNIQNNIRIITNYNDKFDLV